MALTEIKTSGIADDAVTTDKLANAINTERTANTAKVSTTINNNADNRVITGSDTSNTLNAESNVVIDANGKVGIGTASPVSILHLHETGSDGSPIIQFSNGDTGVTTGDGFAIGVADNESPFIYNRENTDLRIATNNTERMRILAGGGLTFNGDTAAANALDDYEEGLHTATLTCTSSGTITLDTNYNQLAYTKIGNWVNVYGRVRITSTSSPSGQQLRVSLPFQSASLAKDAGRVYGTAAIQLADENENHYGIQPTGGGETFVQVGNINTNTVNPADVCSQVNSNSLVTINISYRSV